MVITITVLHRGLAYRRAGQIYDQRTHSEKTGLLIAAGIMMEVLARVNNPKFHSQESETRSMSKCNLSIMK